MLVQQVPLSSRLGRPASPGATCLSLAGVTSTCYYTKLLFERVLGKEIQSLFLVEHLLSPALRVQSTDYAE